MTISSMLLAPYQDLYIYYIRGQVHGNPFSIHENYIGNWQEAEDSFLFAVIHKTQVRSIPRAGQDQTEYLSF